MMGNYLVRFGEDLSRGIPENFTQYVVWLFLFISIYWWGS